MAEDVARFGLVADDGISGPAAQAARALEKLQADIDADTKSLAAMNKAMKNLKQAASPNTAQIEQLGKQITETKNRIGQAQQKFLDLGGAFKKVKPPNLTRGGGGLKETLATIEQMPGPLGRMASVTSKWLGSLSGGRVLLLGLAAGIVAVATAAVLGAKKLTEMAIAAQNARRNELLQLEAAAKTPTIYAMAFGGAANKAADLQRAVDEVAGSVSISRDRVAQYAAQLTKLGVNSKNMKSALEAASVAGSVSEEQGNMAAQWAAHVSLVGGAVDKVAQRYKNRFGGLVQKQMLSLEVQQRKLAESQDALFAGVNIEGLLKAKKAFNDLFSQSTASGRIMQRWLGQLLQPFINGLETLMRVARRVVVELLILGARIENKWLDFRLALRGGAAGMTKFFKENYSWMKYVLMALGPMVAGFGVLISTLDALINLFKYLGKVVMTIFTGGDWAQLGVELTDGIKEGIMDRYNIAVGAVTGLGGEMLEGFGDMFKIRSPSKVMADYGQAIAEGLAQGINAGKGEAQAALMSLAPVPDALATGAEAKVRPAGASVNIAALNVTVGAGAQKSDAVAIGAAIKRELEVILESVAVQMGAPAT